jgi:hypothetical protein
MMHGREKSDPIVVARKPAKSAAQAERESVGRRVVAEGNADRDGTPRTPSRTSVVPGRDRIWQAAKERRKEKFSALLHHVDVGLLRWSWGQLGKAAAGVDGVTWKDYGEGLAAKLLELHGFAHICSRNRNGRFFVKRRSRRDRLRAKVQEIKAELMRQRHEPADQIGHWLRQITDGWFNYHAVPQNSDAPVAFRFHILEGWLGALRRRSQQDAHRGHASKRLPTGGSPNRASTIHGP